MDKIFTDGILFDMDGTIWDNTPLFAASWQRACADSGFDVPFTADTLKGLFGKTMTDIADACIPADDPEVRYKALKLCEEYEMKDLEKDGRDTTYPGLKETVISLSKRIPLFIVSNCQSGYIETFLRKSGLTPYFKDFICYGDNGLIKADNIRVIADRHSLKKPVYLGDIQGDLDACIKAEVGFIWASYGYGKKVDSYLAKISDITELDKICEMYKETK